MPTSLEQIVELVTHPHESLAVELKGWIDPTKPAGKAKIVKACIALRNNNGGYLLIGFDDKTLQIQNENAPIDIRKAFHPDQIQALVTKYAAEPFEARVHYPDVEGSVVVVIEIEAGIRSPVAAKADLKGEAGEPLVTKDRVYVRTLSANNRVSTSEATCSDWSRLTDICFTNREADVGAFLRRHLLGLTPQTIEQLGTTLLHAVKPPPPIEDSAVECLNDGHRRFELMAAKQGALPPHGAWEVAVRIRPPIDATTPNAELLGMLMSINPDYTGWPVWTDTRSFNNEESRPYVADDAWEAFIRTTPGMFSGHIDFWRIHPQGDFYMRRSFAEDLAVGDRAPIPLTTFDFALPIIRIGEALAVALGFAQALGARDQSLAIACRWTGLAGRELTSWANRSRSIFPGKRCRQESKITKLSLPADFAPTSLAEPVEKLVSPVLALFDGFITPRSVYEDLIQRLLNRRL